ncbi:MAG: arsenate reductase (glutaredoxin) [Gammaproteobacteria bacterium]|jgi:arsenate reductase
MKVSIYHNPRCSKSRQTLELLRGRGIEPEVIEYLQTPPDAAALRKILALLGMDPRQLLRTGEPEYRELGLDRDDVREDRIIEAMVSHPRLIQRPIVVAGDAARIGRPPERVLEIIAP